MPVISPDAEPATEPLGEPAADVAGDVAALAVALERVVSMVRRLAPAEGLSLTAISTLRAIEAGGPTRLTELATAQGVTQPAMTQLVARMARDGLVERRGSEHDARVVLVAITPAGADLLARRRTTRARHLTVLLATLPDADRAAVLAATPALALLADLGADA